MSGSRPTPQVHSPSRAGCFRLLDGNSLHHAICRWVATGVTYAVAAKSSSADSKGFVPAANDEVSTVSALTDFSNYGDDVDLIAPGVCINSTWKPGGYNTISGTSWRRRTWQAGEPSSDT